MRLTYPCAPLYRLRRTMRFCGWQLTTPSWTTNTSLIDIQGQKSCQISASVPDPDPPDPHAFGPPGSGSFYQQAKIVEKNLDSFCFVTSFGLFFFEK